jgi:hypothetical protein
MMPVADFTIADHKVGTAKSLSTTSLNQPNQPNPVILTGSHRETEGSAVACRPITIGRVEWHLDWLSARSIRDDRGMHEVGYCTYIMASRSHTLYIGVTGNLLQRIFQHKWRAHNGFTARYNCDRLVWFERRSAPSCCLPWAGWIFGSGAGCVVTNLAYRRSLLPQHQPTGTSKRLRPAYTPTDPPTMSARARPTIAITSPHSTRSPASLSSR